MNIPLRCTCGAVQGELDPGPTYARARCYCKDCQAYARFLGEAQTILDAQGGTDIVATSPAALRFTTGAHQLSCLSLTRKGPLRWYTACCKTPIANTARSPKVAYAGIVSACLPMSAAALDDTFGTARIALNTESARGKVSSTPVATFLGVIRIMGGALGARLRGHHRQTPFFNEAGRPIQAPLTVDEVQRRGLYS